MDNDASDASQLRASPAIAERPLPTRTIVWQETFELPNVQKNWYSDFGIWEIGVPTYGPPVGTSGRRAHQGTNCAATVLSANYPEDRQSRLVYSGPSGIGLVVPDASLNPRLRFWHWWNFNNDDFGQVQISTNNGVNWQALSPKYGSDGVYYIYDSSGKWSRAWLDLKAYAGKTVLLGL